VGAKVAWDVVDVVDQYLSGNGDELTDLVRAVSHRRAPHIRVPSCRCREFRLAGRYAVSS
jgi:hypothetical protein